MAAVDTSCVTLLKNSSDTASPFAAYFSRIVVRITSCGRHTNQARPQTQHASMLHQQSCTHLQLVVQVVGQQVAPAAAGHAAGRQAHQVVRHVVLAAGHGGVEHRHGERNLLLRQVLLAADDVQHQVRVGGLLEAAREANAMRDGVSSAGE